MGQALERSTRMKDVVAHYKRLGEGDPNRPYQWLSARMVEDL